MALPVRDVTRPAALAGQTNGKLSRTILSSTVAQTGGTDVLLAIPAARAWRALTAAATVDGHSMTVATPARSYRPYSEQERIFRLRYYPSIFGTRRWLGQRWRKRSGVAIAAVPGTSNHGWGLAVDVSFSAPALVWLKIHAHRFGWSWETQSESWHLRYWAGDDIPAAVLAHESVDHQEGSEMKLVNDSNRKRLFAVFTVEGTTAVDEYSTYVAGAGEDMPNISYVIDDQIAKGNILKVG